MTVFASPIDSWSPPGQRRTAPFAEHARNLPDDQVAARSAAISILKQVAIICRHLLFAASSSCFSPKVAAAITVVGGLPLNH